MAAAATNIEADAGLTRKASAQKRCSKAAGSSLNSLSLLSQYTVKTQELTSSLRAFVRAFESRRAAGWRGPYLIANIDRNRLPREIVSIIHSDDS